MRSSKKDVRRRILADEAQPPRLNRLGCEPYEQAEIIEESKDSKSSFELAHPAR